MGNKKQAEFWSFEEGVEFLSAGSKEEAFKDYLEEGNDDADSAKLTLYGWTPVPIDQEALAKHVLKETRDYIDENYFFEETHEQSRAIWNAAKVFAETYAKDAMPFFCQIVEEETKTMAEWKKLLREQENGRQK